MKQFYFNTEQFLPINIKEAWDFFSDAKSLSVITPPEMDFKILSDLTDKKVFEGMVIDYTIKPLFGIKVHWQTEIFKVDKPKMFADRQLKGPYKIWEHTHTFVEKENGVLMHDQVKYQLPFGIAGRITHSLLVKKKIENIFIYRRKVLKKIFENGNNNH
ncbi:MAG TPA: SRPBCC family protein [Hanamia sp.]|nr:SRPBCC family protein [Hanamia sp.]